MLVPIVVNNVKITVQKIVLLYVQQFVKLAAINVQVAHVALYVVMVVVILVIVAAVKVVQNLVAHLVI